jgi:CubicO group peptidase (beta-lactamase class C family)
MIGRQLRVLYREFLFRIVDRDVLSTHAKGDASQLLLQLVALLIFVSICFCVPVLLIDSQWTAQGLLEFSWTIEHFLIATTMLVIGLFAVLSWDAMFPGHRDVLVLAPLPIRASTILLAKCGAVATMLGIAVVTLHVVAGAVWPLALNASAHGRAIHTLALTMDPPMPPVAAADLPAVLDRDLAAVRRDGPLAPSEGGGVVVGVWQRGVQRIVAYGAATPNSIFEIGSSTKPFTGLLLATMAEQRTVRLDEPVRDLIPAAHLARPTGSEITLLDLVTHHSGLPNVPTNFHPADRGNPFADYDVPRLYAYLAGRGVVKHAGAPFGYSNLGFGLLGHALSERAGVDFATLLRRDITGPLGMNDTVVSLSPEQRRRFLQGQSDERQPVPAWDFDVLAGAGTLHSTAPDMLTWLRANLHPEEVRAATLSRALIASHQLRAAGRLPQSLSTTGASNVRVAFAWLFRPDAGTFEHGGATAGFTTDAFFNPHDDVAVVVLSNAGPGSSISADVLGAHVRARLDGQPAVVVAEVTIPAGRSLRSAIRLFAAYWLTMLAAGVFIFGLAMSVQAIAASLLSRRHFLRVSPVLQIGAFCLIVGMYFLQPMQARQGTLLSAQEQGMLWPFPSYWFLGLFQQLSGSPALAPLAHDGWIGLGLAVAGTAVAYALSYFGTLRHIAEEPDIAAAVARARWLPAFGGTLQTAVVQFSLRTLFRSAQHRVIFAFYWGLGFALVIIFLKTPRAQQLAEASATGTWQETTVPLLVSTMVMMGFAVLAARVAFAMPRDLPANWIFRVIPSRSGPGYGTARRRALLTVSVVPVWAVSALSFFWMWPWLPALGHLVALALLGLILVEIALADAHSIPFTRSYLPGKSRAHIAVYVAIALLLPATIAAATFERDALQDPTRYAAMLAVLGVVWIGTKSRTDWLGHAPDAPLEFEESPATQALTLEVWDSR